MHTIRSDLNQTYLGVTRCRFINFPHHAHNTVRFEPNLFRSNSVSLYQLPSSCTQYGQSVRACLTLSVKSTIRVDVVRHSPCSQVAETLSSLSILYDSFSFYNFTGFPELRDKYVKSKKSDCFFLIHDSVHGSPRCGLEPEP